MTDAVKSAKPVLYINGDSHSAGAEAVVPFSFAEDDPWEFPPPNRQPHPKNVVASFGNVLADLLGWDAVNNSESASSNQRIIRTTEEWLANNPKPNLVLIGWSTWEREEWLHEGTYYQVNASGTDMVPDDLRDKYKQWIIKQADKELELELDWHEKIWSWHKDLENRDIPHLFFNTYSYFHRFAAEQMVRPQWGRSYIAPYDREHAYYFWLKDQGFDTVNEHSYHYGVDAHQAWANFLKKQVDNTG